MRNELRFLLNALVYVVDESKKETEASLRDLSLHGLSIKSDGFINVEPNSSYVIAVIPEKETNIKEFQLEIESRWVKINKSKMESGFSVMVPFNKAEFQDYLDYLALKGEVQTMPDDEKPEPSAEPEGRGSPPESSAEPEGRGSPPESSGNSGN